MGEEPEEDEVGVRLAGHDRLEVELDVGLPGERRVVAQHPQRPAVADEAPEPLRAPVEELLDEAVRRLAGGAGDALGAMVEIGTLAPTRWSGTASKAWLTG